jgi:hypothetical protein
MAATHGHALNMDRPLPRRPLHYRIQDRHDDEQVPAHVPADEPHDMPNAPSTDTEFAVRTLALRSMRESRLPWHRRRTPAGHDATQWRNAGKTHWRSSDANQRLSAPLPTSPMNTRARGN